MKRAVKKSAASPIPKGKAGPRAVWSNADIDGHLRSVGLQPTSQRLAICRYMLCEADHATAEDVKSWADRNLPKVSLATVYNTLKVLAEAGIIREYRMPHSESAIYDHRVDDHYHFLDEKTGKLIDIDPEDVEGLPKLRSGFKVSKVEVLFRGRSS